MKPRKRTKIAKTLKLTKRQVIDGVTVNNSVDVEIIPYRKLKLDVLKEVHFARKPFIVQDYGKPLGIILPLP